MKAALTAFGVVIERAKVRVKADPGKTRVEVALKQFSNERLFDVLDKPTNQPGIREVRSLVTFPTMSIDGDVTAGSENDTIAG